MSKLPFATAGIWVRRVVSGIWSVLQICCSDDRNPKAGVCDGRVGGDDLNFYYASAQHMQGMCLAYAIVSISIAYRST